MMDYSKMSDFEINKAVAIARGTLIRKGKSLSLYQVEGLDLCTDFCNSWADAGPIIQEYGIELGYDGVAWEASCNLRGITPYSDWKKYPESPCRLAMIVFLMMHDKGEE